MDNTEKGKASCLDQPSQKNAGTPMKSTEKSTVSLLEQAFKKNIDAMQQISLIKLANTCPSTPLRVIVATT